MKTIIAIICIVITFVKAEENNAAMNSGFLWHEVKVDNKTIVFIAHQEAKFIREKIGEWLPLSLMMIKNGNYFLWSIKNVYRKKNKIYVGIQFKNDVGVVGEINFDYASTGEDGKIESTVSISESETRITIKDEDGERSVLIGLSKDIKHFSQKYTISKAMPLWKWENAVVEKNF